VAAIDLVLELAHHMAHNDLKFINGIDVKRHVVCKNYPK
jgi:hypothetical protein